MIEFESDYEQGAKIKVVGVGGAGGNAIDRMINSKMTGVEFIAINTDLQALKGNLAPTKIQIGAKVTKGLGAGANPEIGRKSAEEDKDKIADALIGADMIFITAGMGKGTGTGASPIIAEIAKSTNALTVAVVTKPFAFEGVKKEIIAEEGINELKEKVDTLIVIPNEKLLSISDTPLLVNDAFLKADEVLRNAVAGISDLIVMPGLINVDFADVKTVMTNKGNALMGIGVGTGDKKALQAAEMAITSPLLDNVSIDGAKAALINIVCGPDVTIPEINEAVSMIQKRMHNEGHIIWGIRIDEGMYNEVKMTVIATGFERKTKLPTKEIEVKESEHYESKIYRTTDLDTPAYIRRKISIE
jgi:cell division protein FtsZ